MSKIKSLYSPKKVYTFQICIFPHSCLSFFPQIIKYPRQFHQSRFFLAIKSSITYFETRITHFFTSPRDETHTFLIPKPDSVNPVTAMSPHISRNIEHIIHDCPKNNPAQPIKNFSKLSHWPMPHYGRNNKTLHPIHIFRRVLPF